MVGVCKFSQRRAFVFSLFRLRWLLVFEGWGSCLACLVGMVVVMSELVMRVVVVMKVVVVVGKGLSRSFP